MRKDNNKLTTTLKKLIKNAQNDKNIQSHFAIEVLRNSIKKREESLRQEAEKNREIGRTSFGKDLGEREMEIRDLKGDAESIIGKQKIEARNKLK